MEQKSRASPPFVNKYFLFSLGCLIVIALISYLHLSHEISIMQFGRQHQWKPEYYEFNVNGPSVSSRDPDVIQKIRTKFLESPPKHNFYNLKNPKVQDPSIGQSTVIRRFFKNRKRATPGFFVECGALDGEARSNTLYMERFLHWNGLLIEADPKNYANLKEKRRNAWLSPVCLSTHKYPEMVSFQQMGNRGKIAEDVTAGFIEHSFVDVQCFPLESMLVAMNVTTVDYFSLDVEGSELDILRTIPFDKFDIKTLSVEFTHNVEGKFAIRKFMDDQGYVVHSEVTHGNRLANDFIFVKKDFLREFSDRDLDNIRKDIIRRTENFDAVVQVLLRKRILRFPFHNDMSDSRTLTKSARMHRLHRV